MNAPREVDIKAMEVANKFLEENATLFPQHNPVKGKGQVTALAELLLHTWYGGCDAKEEQFVRVIGQEIWGMLEHTPLRKLPNPAFSIETLPEEEKKD